MKNRKILLPALLSITLLFVLILPASLLNITPISTQGKVKPMDDAINGYSVKLKSYGPVIATGFYTDTELTRWNLGRSIPGPPIENVTWVLESYKEPGNFRVFLCRSITATFETRRVSGRAGSIVFGRAVCNYYAGDYELKGNKLSITRLRSTEAYCGEQLSKLEQEYFTSLRDAESYEIEGGKLRINCGNRLLVFKESYKSMEELPWIIVSPAGLSGLAIFFKVMKREHSIIVVSPAMLDGLVIFFYSMDMEWLPWTIVGSAAVAGLVILLLHKRRHA